MAVWRPIPSELFTRQRPRPARRAVPAGGHRDRQRSAVPRGAGGARRRRGRRPGQEHVPGRDEPRDPHADERDHRDERPAARHAARPTSSATTPRPSGRRATRCSRSSTTSSISRRSRPARSSWSTSRSPSRACVEGAIDVLAPDRGGEAARAPVRHRCGPAAHDRRRPGPAAPDRHQPALERGQVHRARRGRADVSGAPTATHGAGDVALAVRRRGPRHRHRHRAGPAWSGCSSRSARRMRRSRGATAGRASAWPSAGGWPS